MEKIRGYGGSRQDLVISLVRNLDEFRYPKIAGKVLTRNRKAVQKIF